MSDNEIFRLEFIADVFGARRDDSCAPLDAPDWILCGAMKRLVVFRGAWGFPYPTMIHRETL